MSRKRPRDLGREDRALWEQVQKTVRPLRPPPARPASYPLRRGEPAPTPTPIPAFRIGQNAAATGPGTAQPVAWTSPVDKKTARRMRRGKLSPEARLDLHGMTQDAAHRALAAFILGAAGAGKRLVLVITGKGRRRSDDGHIPEAAGILRRNVPVWLRAPALAPHVLDVAAAHHSHGGSGAFYVYLRRRRQP